MAKINLLTIHYGQNKGSFLQTYATKKIFAAAGHDVTLINLVDPRYSLKGYCHAIHDILNIPNWLTFERMRKKFLSPLTSAMNLMDVSLLPPADYTVTGSDQTWNPDITGKNVLTYFQDFVPADCRRVALSASFGFRSWKYNTQLTEKISAELKKFSRISVREKSGVDLCKDVFGVDAEWLPDPTIAWGDYRELSGEIPDYPEIFVFLLNSTPEMNEIIAAVQSDMEIPLRLAQKSYLVKRMPPLWKMCKAHSYNGTLTVRDFLRRIGGSRLIITDSFHGTVFSMLYNKPFISIPGRMAEFYERIDCLLKATGLSYRTVRSIDDYLRNRDKILAPIDYRPINEYFQRERQKFVEFVHETFV